MQSLFLHLLALNPTSLYSLAFVGLLFEANTILFTVAFLTEQGIFERTIIIPLAFAGAFIGNLIWYAIGYLSAIYPNIYGRVVKFLTRPFDNALLRHPFHTVFLTKFIYGLNCAMITRAGQIKMPFWKFFKIDFLATLLWIIILWPIGEITGAVFDAAASFVKYIEIALLIAVIAFLYGKHVISKYAKARLNAETVENQDEKQNEKI